MFARLVDDTGKFWHRHDPRLQTRLNSALSDEQLAEYAIINLGWIEFRERADGTVFVRARADQVAKVCLVEFLYFICAKSVQTVIVTFYTSSWQVAQICTRNDFVKLLGSMINDGEGPTLWEGAPLLSRRLSAHQSSLGRYAELARYAGECAADPRDAGTIFSSLFDQRWSLHQLDGETGQSVIRAIGKGYTPFNPSWLANAVGNSLCNYADRAYGMWVAQSLRDAAVADDIHFHEIDAVVTFPNVGKARLRYSRALIPIRQNKTTYILSASSDIGGIDLRSTVGVE